MIVRILKQFNALPLAMALVLCSLSAALAYLPPLTPGAQHVPPPHVPIDLQYTSPKDYQQPVAVMNLDAFDTPAHVVAGLRARGIYPMCYVNVGATENWRPDMGDFPKHIMGNAYDGWDGEHWLDIRALDELEPILRARFRLCKQKGFLGVDPDNLDGYNIDTGFPLTREDQLRFLRWLAKLAHEEGLAIGLKNAPNLVPELVDDFDWALTESCFAQSPRWCEKVLPFREQGKAVYIIEYTDNNVDAEALCAYAKEQGFVALLKHRKLDGGFRTYCP